MMVEGTVAGLWVYPVKGLRGIELDEAVLLPRGLAQDRRWMVVTPEGRFLTQRELPALARIATRLGSDGLELWIGDERVVLPSGDVGEPLRVTVWRDEVDALCPDPAADRALSAYLGRAVRIVRFPETVTRPCKPHVAPDASTGFADAFPMLVTSLGSLTEVNDAIVESGGDPVPIPRFRPNLVLDGVPARAEDRYRWLHLPGGAGLELVSACERCIVTTTDQITGERLGPEPIATLKRIRASPETKAPCFGRNATLRGASDRAVVLRVGDRVRLAEVPPSS